MPAEDTSKLADTGSLWNNIVGPTIASATTVTVTSRVHHVSGTAAIVTMNPPFPGFQGTVTLIADGLFTWTAAGNIFVAGTSTAGNGRALSFFYDGAKWYPSAIA
jgi:hypothetical protein